jgi:trk system potassium uptake protein TrkA
VHFVIMGCGRVGAMLAHRILAAGHQVSVIDQDESAFVRLGRDFPGRTICGVGFDRATLAQAGIADAAGFAAVSSGDNSNIIAARVVREEFGIRNVVARIYDPRRAEVFERLGIATVATVRWTAAQVFGRLLPASPDREFQDVSGRVTMLCAVPDPTWTAVPLTVLEEETGARIAFVTRRGDGILPRPGMRFQEGDLLHVLAATDRVAEVESALSHPRERTGTERSTRRTR